MNRVSAIDLDIVIPIYNEEDALPLLFRRLDEVFSPGALREQRIERVRYLIVDDGSTDGSAQLVRDRIREGAPAVLYRFSRNFGHQSAVSAGLDRANADLVAVLDADLQDPPELLPELIARWREGFDVVHAQRTKRREGPIRRLGYWVFYRFVAFLSEIPIPLDSGDFCLMDRRVVDAIRALPEKLRFPRVLRAWVGFPQTAVLYERPARQAGAPKYTLRKLYQLATDGIASSSIRLLKLAQLFAASFAILTVLFLGVMIVLLLSRSYEPVTLLFLAGYILVATGNFVVTVCLHILGAYVGRTYLEVKGRPSYLIMEIIGDD
jgi:dolichol-phosphate mannosyltransferase